MSEVMSDPGIHADALLSVATHWRERAEHLEAQVLPLQQFHAWVLTLEGGSHERRAVTLRKILDRADLAAAEILDALDPIPNAIHVQASEQVSQDRHNDVCDGVR